MAFINKKTTYIFMTALLIVAGMMPTHSVRAITFTVTKTADTNDGVCDIDCSLREAIAAANIAAGADVITLPAGTYTLTLGSQLPAVTSEITINGSGAANTVIQANASPNTATYRVLEVSVSGNLTLNDVTVRNGSCTGGCATQNSNGGGILNLGTINITNSVVSNNRAGNNGGGMLAIGTGSVKILNSTFSSNTASADGGGLYIFSTVNSTVTNSTFYNNTASTLGGGIHIAFTTLRVENSTFSGNQTLGGSGISDLGGGIFAGLSSTLVVQNSTFSQNGSSLGSGVATFGGSIASATNSIFANSTRGNNCYLTVVNGGNNIDDGTSCNFGSTNGSMSNTDPFLGPLADNGGLTQTHALLSASPAIDGVTYNSPNSSPATDQRGSTRPQGSGYDIGSYEVRDINPPVVTQMNIPTLGTLFKSQSITLGITQIIVRFNQAVTSGGGATAADNPSNYILVRAGGNGIQTISCANGVSGGDISVSIDSITYTSNGGNGPFEATLNVNGGNPLPSGIYELFVCGTTSITNVFGEELNGGWVDFHQGFTVLQSTTGGGTTGGTGTPLASNEDSGIDELPKTGFSPNRVTNRPPQPADLIYSKLGDLWLDIPTLNVKSNIVGVPQGTDKSWDVTWLGNEVGWLNGTAFPTWNGNSVLTAHVINASGLDGPFAALDKLKYGDQVIVHMGGAKYIYEVRETKLSRPYSTNYAFESKQDAAYLTLITCSGYNPLNDTYLFRRVVRAVLVSTVSE